MTGRDAISHTHALPDAPGTACTTWTPPIKAKIRGLESGAVIAAPGRGVGLTFLSRKPMAGIAGTPVPVCPGTP